MNALLAFGLAALVTYLLRSCMTVFGQRLTDSPRLASGIGLVSPAVLAAIVASAVFLEGGELVRPHLVELAAVIAAIVAVRRTNNVSMALFVGLPVYWIGALVPML